ncbi:MAG: extracellular solute-binding protein [Dehalococcoidia bacterium]|nr:extracellular solute-binding protein [Dehalococcoidia bacterium]
MNNKLAIIAAALAIMVLAACGGWNTPAHYVPTQTVPPTAVALGETWQTRWDETVAMAGKEGRVIMVYATISPKVRSTIGKAFKDRFGIEIEFVTGEASELTLKLRGERQVGLYLGDVVLAGAGPLITSMSPAGLLDPLPPVLILPEVVETKKWQSGVLPFADRKTKVMGLTTQYNVGLTRNTELVNEGDLVSFHDLLRPEWKGKIVMIDPSVRGSGSDLVVSWALGAWGVEETKEYLRGLVQQEVTLIRDSRLHVEWVARGKYPLGLGASKAHLASFVRAGAPVLPMEMAEGGYITWGPGGLGLLIKPAHPAAATVFINWLLSREGQIIFSKAFGTPSKRIDVPATDIDPSLVMVPGDKVYIEDEQGILANGQVITMVKEVMAPLFK